MYTEEEKLRIINDTLQFCRQAIVKAIKGDQSDLLVSKMLLDIKLESIEDLLNIADKQKETQQW